ncbi:MAG: hypothetical protein HQM16_11060 [Deltaproteobacteria bacterium]|nr:hypothetical protein [Deltaproteobacteria bacterium]
MKQYFKINNCEMMTAAIKILGINAALFWVWSDRLGPYNPALSTFLNDLAHDEMLSQQKLINAYNKQNKTRFDLKPDGIDRALDNACSEVEHFFVLNEEMEKNIILSVSKTLFDTFKFFQWADKTPDGTSAKEIFRQIAAYEKQHLDELKENIEHQIDFDIEDPSAITNPKETDYDDQQLFRALLVDNSSRGVLRY